MMEAFVGRRGVQGVLAETDRRLRVVQDVHGRAGQVAESGVARDTIALRQVPQDGSRIHALLDARRGPPLLDPRGVVPDKVSRAPAPGEIVEPDRVVEAGSLARF